MNLSVIYAINRLLSYSFSQGKLSVTRSGTEQETGGRRTSSAEGGEASVLDKDPTSGYLIAV